jgi:AcrR family transcriptional regulator
MLEDREISRSSNPEETRQRILAATRELLGLKGRRGTTTREVAERAGVNEATLFRHFRNKESLIQSCAQQYCGASALQDLVASLNGDLEDDLTAIAMALYERLTSIRDLIIMSLAEEGQEQRFADEAWRGPQVIHGIIVDYMVKRIESGELRGDPRMLAKFFMGMVFARAVGGQKFPDAVAMTPREVIAWQVNVFLNGVRSK